MKSKKSVVFTIVLVLVFVVVYTIVAIAPSQKEIQFVSQWTLPISSEPENDLKDQELMPFVLADILGYFTQTGSLVYKYKIEQNCTLSSDFFVFYNSNSKNFSLQKPDSTKLVSISRSGFPFVFENRIFLFSPGGTSCSEYDIEGSLLWTYEGYSPISDFAANKNSCVLGFVDGEVHTIYSPENNHASIYPGGSEYSVIYGVDISPDSNYVACISGYDRQRFILINKNGIQQKIVFHEYLENQTKEPACVYFTKDSRFVYYNSAGSLDVLDCKKLISKHFKIKGKIVSISEIPNNNIVFVLSREENNCRITFMEGMTKILGHYDYSAENTFVSTKNDFLFIGLDDAISCIKVVRN
ncbi:MAG: hypothetical protein ACTTHG_07790 [Treponemataceae bacterium]